MATVIFNFTGAAIRPAKPSSSAKSATPSAAGRPILFDRFYAAQLGGKAVDLLVEGRNNAVAILQHNDQKGFHVDGYDANRFRDRWGHIHARYMHPSFYDRDRMMPSQTGIDYLLPIFTDAIGEDDMEVVRAEIVRARQPDSCLSQHQHRRSKAHPLRPIAAPTQSMSIHVALHHRTSLQIRPAGHPRAASGAAPSRPAFARAHFELLTCSRGRKTFHQLAAGPAVQLHGAPRFSEKTDLFEVEVDLVAEMSVFNPFDFFLEPEAERRHFLTRLRWITNWPRSASSAN